MQKQQQAADHRNVGHQSILHADPHRRDIDLPEAQQQKRCNDCENDQQDDPDVGVPVEQHHGDADKLDGLADPERDLGHRGLELGQPRDVIVDMEFLQVAKPDDHEQRDDHQPANAVEH